MTHRQSESHWNELLRRLDEEPTPSMDDQFRDELANCSAEVFVKASKTKRLGSPTLVVTSSLVMAGCMIGIAVLAPWRAPESAEQQPIRVVAKRTPAVGDTSCWNLRQAYAASDTDFSEALDKQLSARQPRTENIGWSTDLFSKPMGSRRDD